MFIKNFAMDTKLAKAMGGYLRIRTSPVQIEMKCFSTKEETNIRNIKSLDFLLCRVLSLHGHSSAICLVTLGTSHIFN